MKIAYASDLHIEFDKRRLNALVKAVDKDTDVLVLAGDIHTLEGIGEALLHLSATLMPMHIVYVAGNHEYYGAEVTSLNRELRLVFQECPNLHFLEQASIVIDNVVFYGTTLWTGFDAYPEFDQVLSEDNAMHAVADFHHIYYQQGLLTSEACKQLYQQSRNWLLDALATHPQKYPDKTSIVVSHFPPLAQLSHQQIPLNSLSNYFQANCADIIAHHQPYAWIYGHNHWSDSQSYHQTRLLSCQLGYPKEQCNSEQMLAYLEL